MSTRQRDRNPFAWLLAAGTVWLLVGASVLADAAETAWYPYGSAAFSELIADSYRAAGKGDSQEFRAWMRQAYRKAPKSLKRGCELDLEETLHAERQALRSISNPAKRAEAEVERAAWVHRLVKQLIPRFSLDRGYEFRNAVRYGERQCFLQSVLIAALLQDLGCRAGVVMVFRNSRGEESNNGHAVVLLRLPDQTAILVDASDREPLAHHQGLMARTGRYRYVLPEYGSHSDRITCYLAASNRHRIAADRVLPLDLSFLRSQFWYYRGERAAGGVISPHRTRAGLAASREALTRSVELCPDNPLAVYMLARTYLYQGNRTRARACATAASRLYAEYGWTPAGLRDLRRAVASRAVAPLSPNA